MSAEQLPVTGRRPRSPSPLSESQQEAFERQLRLLHLDCTIEGLDGRTVTLRAGDEASWVIAKSMLRSQGFEVKRV